MKKKYVDINVDVGEGMGNESLILPLVSSCNIACGGHAGNTSTMQEIVRLAKMNDVKIGAHPSFPDKEHFGRLEMDMPVNDLFESLKQQILNLQDVVLQEGATLHHVKPHGALYNMAAVKKTTAQVVINVIKALPFKVKLYVPYQSVIAKMALQQQVTICYEAFADRAYNEDYTLVSRLQKDALITDSDVMFNHVYNMMFKQQVKTITGLNIPLQAHTFCVHGDNKNAVALIEALKIKLEQHNLYLK